MNNEEKKYLELLDNIIKNGNLKNDRTKVGTYSLFGTQLKFSLENNKVPMLTTKKMFLKGIVEELLFFLRGETNTKKLEDKGINIWKGNTSREFLDNRGLNNLPEGDMGKGYGFQWRNFGGTETEKGFDQLEDVIFKLKNNPNDRRIIINAWNPKQLNEMALPPCHLFCQFYVSDNNLSCQFYQRSVDSFLGLPFNILSYSILTNILAKISNLNPKELIFIGGDTHIYTNHINQVNEQILRQPYDFPTLKINKNLFSIKDIEDLKFNDFEIIDYKSHSTIKAPMAI